MFLEHLQFIIQTLLRCKWKYSNKKWLNALAVSKDNKRIHLNKFACFESKSLFRRFSLYCKQFYILSTQMLTISGPFLNCWETFCIKLIARTILRGNGSLCLKNKWLWTEDNFHYRKVSETNHYSLQNQRKIVRSLAIFYGLWPQSNVTSCITDNLSSGRTL
jgi:hypothetical protein